MPYKDKQRQREYQNERLQKRRNDWLMGNGPCMCGSWNDLQVDHRNPSEKVDHKVWSWSEQRRYKELQKCQVLCSACHLKKTIQERHEAAPLIHGTLAGYKTHRCRCIICKKANADWKAENQRKNGALAHLGEHSVCTGEAVGS